MNDADLIWTITVRVLATFSVIFWLITGIGVLLVVYGGEPGAISIVLGVGVWAIATTVGAIFWRLTK